MHYALLVGINRYKSDFVLNLRGCETDLGQMESYLSARFDDQIKILSLKSEEAHRDTIISGFETHLAKAEAGELAIFFFRRAWFAGK